MFSINYATIVDPVLRGVRRYVPDFAGMKAGDSVLDVCCGSGAQVYEYTRRGLVATGLDNSQEMFALAEKYYKNGASGASFKLGDAAHLPFADGSFDFTSISMALHDKDFTIANMIVSEMKRVTRPGGMLVFVDYSVPLPRSVTGCFIRAIEFMAGGEHFRNFRCYMKNGGMRRAMEINGLKVVKETRVKNGNITLLLACAPSFAP
ncbi:MAG: methyltransferase domain-containing protein [Dehalococcoidia bacterium]|nr:MAG: methyltransferase domain-containing protein [Dehalococcoidia bacterium]